MKLNQLLITVSFFCMSTLIYPVHFPALLKAIIRIERFEKQGHATIDLCHDQHNICLPLQEDLLVQQLSRKQGHVYVEDPARHDVGDEKIQNNLDFNFIPKAVKGSLCGLVNRLRNLRISASSIECRAMFAQKPSLSNEYIVEDYKKVIEQLKVAEPQDPISTDIIERCQYRDEGFLDTAARCDQIPGASPQVAKNVFRINLGCGFEIPDMIALKQLYKQDGTKYKALIAGSIHCEGVGLCLEKLGFKRTKVVQEVGKEGRLISRIYGPYLPTPNTTYEISQLDAPIPQSLPSMPLLPNQIKEYFEKPDTYKVS